MFYALKCAIFCVFFYLLLFTLHFRAEYGGRRCATLWVRYGFIAGGSALRGWCQKLWGLLYVGIMRSSVPAASAPNEWVCCVLCSFRKFTFYCV